MERTLFDFLVAVVSHRGERERGENSRSSFCVARADGGKLEKLIFSSARLITYICPTVSSPFHSMYEHTDLLTFHNIINK